MYNKNIIITLSNNQQFKSLLNQNDTGQRVTNSKLKGKFDLKKHFHQKYIQNGPNDTSQRSSSLKNDMLQHAIQPNRVNMQYNNASETNSKTKSPTQGECGDDALLISNESSDSPISNGRVPPLLNRLPQKIFYRPFSKHNSHLEANSVPNDINSYKFGK
ncbi:hypothetical protein GWI33_006951 [Rhynchophorus ferrugineus]|uniref:Uncharacterized protein n=1 Tax=Rhynchophorus ferrugineus TaxID=354439 RepID=A0A834IE68_RHYFE|nr:hypothetical protein GWI33_006951 [Rhynchophorus ferrugineus]